MGTSANLGWLVTLNLDEKEKQVFHISTMFIGTLVKQLFVKINNPDLEH